MLFAEHTRDLSDTHSFVYRLEHALYNQPSPFPSVCITVALSCHLIVGIYSYPASSTGEYYHFARIPLLLLLLTPHSRSVPGVLFSYTVNILLKGSKITVLFLIAASVSSARICLDFSPGGGIPSSTASSACGLFPNIPRCMIGMAVCEGPVAPSSSCETWNTYLLDIQGARHEYARAQETLLQASGIYSCADINIYGAVYTLSDKPEVEKSRKAEKLKPCCPVKSALPLPVLNWPICYEETSPPRACAAAVHPA